MLSVLRFEMASLDGPRPRTQHNFRNLAPSRTTHSRDAIRGRPHRPATVQHWGQSSMQCWNLDRKTLPSPTVLFI